MKDTRAGGGAIACKCMNINELERRVVGFHAEPGFFAGEIKSPLNPCIHGTGSFFIPVFIPFILYGIILLCIFPRILLTHIWPSPIYFVYLYYDDKPLNILCSSLPLG